MNTQRRLERKIAFNLIGIAIICGTYCLIKGHKDLVIIAILMLVLSISLLFIKK